ncbi:myb-like protein I [Anopheles nili]|uniref:myb-like protein I n=1 Tax=Anopheles nili TaxID=185578 RepID=UPI00237AAC79|nr:myb-like protein I [Anopheles nili]
MSTKKQDIVDSWEEIDDERLASTITILKNTTAAAAEVGKSDAKPIVTGIAARQNSLPQMLEEELRPKMVPQRMQILKRPQSSSGADGKNATDSKPKAQIKSLDQRKQEYAQARLRILGSAHDDEEAETKKTTPAANGYRINNVNNVNNNNTSGNSSSNSSTASGSGGTGIAGNVGNGEAMPGNGANNNANNMYRFHPPYRQQAPIGTFPPTLQNGPPRGQGAGMFYPTTPVHQQHHHHHPLPMHSALQMQHHTFPHMAHHHHPQQQQQQQQQQQHNSIPYQHQQHFAGQHLNHQTGGHMFMGGRNGSSIPTGSTTGYYATKGYGDGNGPMPPLLGHAPPGALVTHQIPYNGIATGGGGAFGQANSHSTPANQHVLRLPAGPDGSQGFNMRR